MFNALQSRDALTHSIRAFFRSEGFDEVETPFVLETPCMELHIDAIPSGDGFFRTSPELSQKKLLAQGAEKIFEIGPCFRQGEKGRLHNPEYTMLEWYRANSDYMVALEDTQNLLAAVLECRRDLRGRYSPGVAFSKCSTAYPYSGSGHPAFSDGLGKK